MLVGTRKREAMSGKVFSFARHYNNPLGGREAPKVNQGKSQPHNEYPTALPTFYGEYKFMSSVVKKHALLTFEKMR